MSDDTYKIYKAYDQWYGGRRPEPFLEAFMAGWQCCEANKPAAIVMKKDITQGELATLMAPAFEAVPIDGHDWHELSAIIKRYENGDIGLLRITWKKAELAVNVKK